jgi:hypothetical protein
VTKITDAGYQTQNAVCNFDSWMASNKNFVEANGGTYSGCDYTGSSEIPVTGKLFNLGKKKTHRWTKSTDSEWLQRDRTTFEDAKYSKSWDSSN